VLIGMSPQNDKINKELEFPVEFFSKLEGVKDINNFIVKVMEKLSKNKLNNNENVELNKDLEHTDMEN